MDFQQPPSLPELINDKEEWEVERILRKRECKQGRHQVVQYLVLWKGFPLHEATWELVINL